MANFPNSVYSPSAVSNGQTIDASRDNGQDAEITAIEDGVLNGNARLNVSGLQVGGASTFAVRPVTPPPEFAQVYLASSVTLGSSAASTLSWLAEEFVTNSSMHSTGSNPERLVPQSTGIYRFSGQVVTGLFASTGSVSIAIRDSSGTNICNVQYGVSTQTQIINVSGQKRFDALGSYGVFLFGMSNQSTMSLSSGIGNSWFSMHKL